MLPISVHSQGQKVLNGTTYDEFYQIYSTSLRAQIFGFCDIGRSRWNNKGLSYWSTNLMNERIRFAKERGFDETTANNSWSAISAVMSKVCPDVW